MLRVFVVSGLIMIPSPPYPPADRWAHADPRPGAVIRAELTPLGVHGGRHAAIARTGPLRRRP